jgi:hypothetical protein
LAFQPSDSEPAWWGLSQKRVVRTKFDIYVLASVYKEFSLVSVNIYNMQH